MNPLVFVSFTFVRDSGGFAHGDATLPFPERIVTEADVERLRERAKGLAHAARKLDIHQFVLTFWRRLE